MSDAEPIPAPAMRAIRSFVLRQGRLTQGQARAMQQLAPQFVLPAESAHLDANAAFAHVRPLVLEIGFGNGQALLACALSEPQFNFIGAEVHAPGVGQLLLAIEKQQLENVRIWHGDVLALLAKIPAASFAQVRIWFPDPWHKSRHHKRRLVQPAFVALLAEKLKPCGLLHLATDWQPYAEHMLAVLQASPQFANAAQGFAEKPLWRPQTHFERRGLKLGHGVWDLLFSRHA
jgi:tRNA (guanine-N7-)-methyltransferase